ncbi:hypothetical protein GCM10009624_15300 [Gordonia sinesedis]
MAAIAGVAALAACGGEEVATAPPAAPADMLLRPAQLPAVYVPTQVSVTDLTAANQARIDDGRTADVVPADCRPTADAALNPQVRADNSAVLAAANGDAGLVELVTTARRDLMADLRATSGSCARSTMTIRRGNLAGARVETTYTPLPDPDLTAGADGGSAVAETAVDQTVAVASSVRTTLPDGGIRTQSGYAGYALVRRPGAESVTVQLTVSGATSAAAPTPSPAAEPMSRDDFVALFGAAIRVAATAGR